MISGYLITTIIINELAAGEFSVKRFYERRARRLLPALFSGLLVCLPFCYFWLTPFDFKNFGGGLVATASFSSNVFFWLDSGYFSNSSELKPLLHTWTLAVEEQYYVIYPLFLLIAWRFGLVLIRTLTAIMLATSLGVAHSRQLVLPMRKLYLGSFI